MKILITAATAFEIQPLLTYLSAHPHVSIHSISTGICGVGVLAHSYKLNELITLNRPHIIIQAGIAGSFNETEFPSVCVIGKDRMADEGVLENENWKDLFDLNLQQINEFPFTNSWLVNPTIPQLNLLKLPAETAVTVNQVTSDHNFRNIIQQKYQPAIESMEGAAFHYTCLQKNIPFLQLRSVSNLVGERDKTNWKIKEAIALLNETLIKYIEILNHEFNIGI
ncbi:MAG: hypothetical protein JWN76_871 [Chitinophagaceae bacterium]|nr:hypothetical protein [Chitinophagaceae bacterium]